MTYLQTINQSILSCTNCTLCQGRRKAVPGVGSDKARTFLIAEKPGRYEDETGIPMVGKAGEIFDDTLQMVGLRRRDFFITNMVKCYVPYGEVITMTQLAACKPWLEEQLEAIKPLVIVLCGNYAISEFYPGERIGNIHGQPRTIWAPWDPEQHVILVPTYHPSAALRNEDLKPILVDDFRVVASLVPRE